MVGYGMRRRNAVVASGHRAFVAASGNDNVPHNCQDAGLTEWQTFGT